MYQQYQQTQHEIEQELFQESVEYFDKREEIIGLYAVLFTNIIRQRKYTEQTGFPIEDLISICFAVLSYISEAYYLNLKIKDEDIERHIYRYYERRYQQELEPETAKELSKYLIENVLQNEGVAYEYPAYSFETNQLKKIPVRLITGKRQERREKTDESLTYYELTAQGYQLLFSTKEIQDETQISIEQMKVAHALSKERYDRALRHAKEACRAVRQQLAIMDLFIINARKGFNHVTFNEYEILYKDLFDTLTEQKEDAVIISKQVYTLQQDINDKVDEKALKNLGLLNAIAVELNGLLGLHQKLIVKYHEINDVYAEAIQSQPLFESVKTLSIEQDVLRKMEENVSVGYQASILLKYFGHPTFKPFFSPTTPYRPQQALKVVKEEGQAESAVDLSEYEEENRPSQLERQMIQQQQQQMKQIVVALLTKLNHSPHYEFELREWLAELEESEDEAVVTWFNTSQFGYVLLKLYDELHGIEVEKLKKEVKNSQLFMESTSVISFKTALIELTDTRPELFEAFTRFESIRSEESSIIEYAYVTYDEENRRVQHDMTVTNLIIKGVS